MLKRLKHWPATSHDPTKKMPYIRRRDNEQPAAFKQTSRIYQKLNGFKRMFYNVKGRDQIKRVAVFCVYFFFFLFDFFRGNAVRNGGGGFRPKTFFGRLQFRLQPART